ncbi:hypothetical protein GGR50DRAFT_330108 [Xylaria sp. CBS 124048]|nr:hypothetical protein GGR50DRAFT_330108 [Xylaria sp. CBS 124048]
MSRLICCWWLLKTHLIHTYSTQGPCNDSESSGKISSVDRQLVDSPTRKLRPAAWRNLRRSWLARSRSIELWVGFVRVSIK